MGIDLAEFPIPDGVEDLTGRKVGRLTVTGWSLKKNNTRHWICECVCGKSHIVSHYSLIYETTQSCGCYAKEVWAANAVIARATKGGHGDSGSSEWISWNAMTSRCYVESAGNYDDYGGKGITVCDRWRGQEGYVNFLEDMGRKPSPKHSLDRFPNNKGNYGPDNCRWATQKQQNRNTRNNKPITAFGKTQLCIEWAEETGLPYHLIHKRVFKSGWEPERALSTPPTPRNERFRRQRNTDD